MVGVTSTVPSERVIFRRVGYRLGLQDTFQDEGGNEYQSFLDIFEDKRRTLLQQHYWGFAVGFAEPQLLVKKPSHFFKYAHAWPADFISVNYLNISNTPFINDGPYQPGAEEVFSNFQKIYLCYTRDITQVDLFSPLFREALILSIAMEMCLPFGQDKEHLDRLEKRYNELKFEAMHIDNRTNPEEHLRVTNYDRTRRGLNFEEGYADSEGSGNPLGFPTVAIPVTPLEGTPVDRGQ